MESIQDSSNYKLKDFKKFKAKRYLQHSSKNTIIRTLMIPTHFSNTNLIHELKHINYLLYPCYRRFYPQIAKDLIRSIDIKHINNPKDFAQKVKMYNYNIVKYLDKLEVKDLKLDMKYIKQHRLSMDDYNKL